MAQRSRYDHLHDEFAHTPSPKAGTRYERLMALVAKALHQEGAVVHDIKLVGESGVKHQIDVSLEFGGRTKRILIECKDLDLSGKNVGLGIIRDFWGVVADVKPDAAIVVTCNGFSRPALKFAKHKGIQLAVLREYEHEPAEGEAPTMRQIIVEMKFTVRDIIKVDVDFDGDQDAHSAFMSTIREHGFENSTLSRSTPLTVGEDTGGTHFMDWLEREGNATIPDEFQNTDPVTVTLPAVTVWVGRSGPLVIPRTVVHFDALRIVIEDTLVIGKIAKLLLEEIGGETLIIYDDQLRRYDIDDGGQVVGRPRP